METTLDALLRHAYEGEIIGCAMYQELLASSSGEHREALQLLYDIERLTADALMPLISHYGVEVSDADAIKMGNQLGASLTGKPWKSMWMEVIGLAEDYLHDLNRLADVLPSTHTAIGRQAVEHEEALIAFAHREIADDPDSPAPLRAYLGRHRRA